MKVSDLATAAFMVFLGFYVFAALGIQNFALGLVFGITLNLLGWLILYRGIKYCPKGEKGRR